jgi:predicted extracellular nuclease
VIGPDGPFFPAGARRVADGVDTDDAADWVISDFGLGAANTPTAGGFDGCAPISLTIPEIQGDGQFSDFDGEVVVTSGIVTAISDSGFDGFIQDPVGDGDPATSDGIFVDDFDDLAPAQVGDLITIEGTVEEQQFGNALPLTRINNPELVSVDSTGNSLPTPVEVNDLPDQSIAAAIAFWEPLEGMRVEVDNGRVVGPTNGFGEFVLLTKDDAKPGSGYFPQTKQILLRSLGENDVDYNPERVLVDDLTLAAPIATNPGDIVKSLVGVVDYSFGNYKIQPTESDLQLLNLPKVPVSKRSGANGNAVITTYNVENLFDLVDEPGKDDIETGGAETPDELETQLTKLAASIEDELELPAVMVLQEVENTAIAQELGDRVNAAAGTDYTAASFETSDGRGIEVAFLYDADRATLVDAFQLSGDDVEAAFGPDSASPGREPLYGEFLINGGTVHIVGNHFKSKGGDDPIFSIASAAGEPFNRITEVQRKLQAQVVRDFVNAILDGDPDALVMVTGDLNDFEFGEPGEGSDDPLSILEGGTGEVPLTNLVFDEKDAERFSFVFDGNSQVLDHMLVSPILLEANVAVDFLHFNASFQDGLEADPSTTIRASDHDPLEGRFDL